MTCPNCGGPMERRMRRSDNHPFMGCVAFPGYRGTLDMDGSKTRRPRNLSGLPRDLGSDPYDRWVFDPNY